jgi:hypothetical protein
MLQKILNKGSNRLEGCPQHTMERILKARQRAFASSKPCHTAQSVNDKIAELLKRLADPTDAAARDDTLVFMSYRYTSIPKQLILKLKVSLERHDDRLRLLKEHMPDHQAMPVCEMSQPIKENVVNLHDRLNDLADVKTGEEPLWYKIYLHTELGNYAQVR